jgi:hypothetical protein
MSDKALTHAKSLNTHMPTKIDTRPIPINEIRVGLIESESILDFLNHLINASKIKGIRSRVAEAARCQASYLSQVFAGTASLSIEHLYGIAEMLSLNSLEWSYVRELGLLDRAANNKLKEDSKRRLLKIRAELRAANEQNTNENMTRGSLNADDLFWSVANWQVNAILCAIEIPHFRTVPSIAKLLRVTVDQAQTLTKELLQRDFLRKDLNGDLVSNLPDSISLGGATAGTMFRNTWVQHGIERSMTGYKDGYQKGGVFTASDQEFEEFKEELASFLRAFFGKRRNTSEANRVCYFGVDLFDV